MIALRRGALALGVLAATMASVCLLQAGSARADPLVPSQDPFYSYSGSLAGIDNGTVLRTRNVSFSESGLTIPITTTQVLYRTTNEQGDPTVAVATVFEPLSGATNKIVSYQWAYDGLASNCDPSYAIQGGSPTEDTNQEEEDLMIPLLLAGETVVTSDYESEDNDFAAGREEGQITLDGIKASEQLLGLAPSTQVALLGYSGGAIASDWASELAPDYAPRLDIVGTAMGGIAVDLAHNLTYVDGSQEWSGAIPAALVGISRAFNINLSDYLSSSGMKIADAVGSSCLESDLGSYPGLTLEQMLKPQYTNIDQIPAFVNAINSLIMGSGGTPEEPMFMGVGDADGTGDDVMVDADDEALAQKYCGDGLAVQFTLYQGQDHGNAAIFFLPSAITWVIGRLAGVPADNGCSSIPAGDSLAPLPATSSAASGSTPGSATTAGSAKSRLELQYRGESVRTVRLRIRAVGAAFKGLSIRLETKAGKLLASKKLNDAKGKLLSVSLTTHARLKPGSYRIIAREGTKTLVDRLFTVKATKAEATRRAVAARV